MRGHATVPTKELLDHLHSSYVKITKEDLRDNEKRTNQPYEPSSPIEVLFDQIEYAIDSAAVSKTEFKTQQIVKTSHNLAYDTGVH